MIAFKFIKDLLKISFDLFQLYSILIFQKYITYSSLKRSGLMICVSFWMYHLTWAPSIWNTAWCAA